MLDWIRISKDPNSSDIFKAWKGFYDSISELVFLTDLKLGHQDFVVDLIKSSGDKILDIGIAEHTEDYIDKDSWFHRKLRDAGSEKEVWGVDINGGLIDHIKKKYGWSNLFAHDATTTPLVKDYFDVIHAGDVIEHVSNVGGFIEFCRDSLKPGGHLIVSTPNPHAFEFIKRARVHGMIPANAEHTCWISAPSMNELCRRYGMEFEKAIFLCGKKKVKQSRIFGKSLMFKYRDLLWYDSLWVIKKPL